MGDGPRGGGIENDELPWQSLADEASDPLFVLNAELRVRWANRRACVMLGRDLAEIVGHIISDFFWSAEDVVREPLRVQELSTGESKLFERTMRSASGERRVLEVSARAVGKGLVLAIARDATERVDALEQLKVSEASLRALIEGCPEGIIVHANGIALYSNTAFAKLLGFDSPASVVGTNILELVLPDDRARVATRVEALLTGNRALPFAEGRLLRRDGTTLIVSVSGVSITYERQAAIVAIVRDETQQRSILAQLAHAEKMASLGLLSAGVAHEVNNPLAYLTLRLRALSALKETLETAARKTRASIAAAVGEEVASTLVDADLGEEQFGLFADHVATALEGAERVRTIVEDLRMFSRIETDTGRLLDVRVPLKRALSMVEDRLGQSAKIFVDDEKPPPVLASEGRMTQVFVNLLVNAGQAFADAPGAPHEVHIRIGVEGDRVVVSFRDTGGGIAPENLPRVFEPFFTTKPVGVGTGLGLSICHGIVAAHGGEIRVESRIGVGSTFTVSLPRAPIE